MQEPHYAQDHHFQHGGQLSVEDSIAAAVAQERLAQDARNQQVLQVLKEKDHLIQQLQADQGYLHEQVCWWPSSLVCCYSVLVIRQAELNLMDTLQDVCQEIVKMFVCICCSIVKHTNVVCLPYMTSVCIPWYMYSAACGILCST